MHAEKRILWMLLIVCLTAGLFSSCGEIVEEEEETDVTETVEVEQDSVDMISDIDEKLALLASVYDTVTAEHPGGVNEYDFIDANPTAFDAIVTWGEDAVPYLCEVGAGYREAFANMRTSPEEYAKCILAYTAAQEIDESTFNRAYASPDGVHVLYRTPSVLWGMGDGFEGILYDIFLSDAHGGVLTEATGFSSLAYIDWTEDGRYAVVSDRLMDKNQLSMMTVFDTERARAVGLPLSEVRDQIIGESGYACKTFSLRYLDTVSADVLRIWLGITLTGGGVVTGYYDYDMTKDAVTAVEYAPFERDGVAFADRLHLLSDGEKRNYWHTGTQILRFDTEKKNGAAVLSLDGKVLCSNYARLDQIRVTDTTVIVDAAPMDGGASVPLLYDLAGQERTMSDGAKKLYIRAEEAIYAHTFTVGPKPERQAGILHANGDILYIRYYAQGIYYLLSLAPDGTLEEHGVYTGDLSEFAATWNTDTDG